MRQVIIYPDREDGGWVAEVPSLPGCVSDGQTVQEAISNVRDAIEAWLETARAHGDPVPDDPHDVRLVDVA
jgi:predicted RNase H-like HicB family nuclease